MTATTDAHQPWVPAPAPADGDAADLVIDRPEDATPAWATAILRRRGVDAEVAEVSCASIGNGQMSENHRLTFRYRHGRGPESLVLKTAAGTPEIRARVFVGYRSELGFYQRFAADTAIRLPHCWYAAHNEDALSFSLVLEDIRHARAGSQTESCTLDQAAAAVRNLAGLHASFWNQHTIPAETPWLRDENTRLPFMGKAQLAATDGFVDRFRDQLPPGDADILRRAAEHTADWQRYAPGRCSLIHGDYRLDNLLFTAEADDATGVVTVDWQSLEYGLPARDVAYFLATALDPARRRAHEGELVRAYHRRLVDSGVADYTAEECFDDYRLGMLQGPLITVIGCMYAGTEPTEDSDRMFLSMAANACTAIRDLGTLERPPR